MQMEEEGVDAREWLSSRDGRVRESHDALDGEIVRGTETYSNGLRFPQDPEGSPDETVQCRCVELPAVGGDARSQRCAAHMRNLALYEIREAAREAQAEVAKIIREAQAKGHAATALTNEEVASIAVIREAGKIDERIGMWRAVARAKSVRSIENQMTSAMSGIINGWRGPILKELADMGILT